MLVLAPAAARRVVGPQGCSRVRCSARCPHCAAFRASWQAGARTTRRHSEVLSRAVSCGAPCSVPYAHLFDTSWRATGPNLIREGLRCDSESAPRRCRTQALYETLNGKQAVAKGHHGSSATTNTQRPTDSFTYSNLNLLRAPSSSPPLSREGVPLVVVNMRKYNTTTGPKSRPPKPVSTSRISTTTGRRPTPSLHVRSASKRWGNQRATCGSCRVFAHPCVVSWTQKRYSSTLERPGRAVRAREDAIVRMDLRTPTLRGRATRGGTPFGFAVPTRMKMREIESSNPSYERAPVRAVLTAAPVTKLANRTCPKERK